MAQYYFHIRDQAAVIPDDEGAYLPDVEAARKEAHLSALDLAMADLRGGRGVDGRMIEVTDEKGHIVHVLPIRAVLN